MRYTVVWLTSASNELATIWVEADDRSAVVSAAHVIEQRLRDDPHLRGVSALAGLRKMTVGPLTAYFRYREPDRLVEAASVVIAVPEG